VTTNRDGVARVRLPAYFEALNRDFRYQLTVTAPLPEADQAARAIGRDRFQAFVDQVGRQIAGGGRTLGSKPDGEGTP